MKLYSRDGSFALVSVGPVARGVIAIGGAAAVGGVSIGGAASVGVVAIGINSVGAVAAGVNAGGGLAFGVANAMGGFVFSLVNGIGASVRAGVNEGSLPALGWVFAVLLLAASARLRWWPRAPADAPPRPQLVPMERALERGGWVEARLGPVDGERVVLDGVARPAVDAALRAALERERIDRPVRVWARFAVSDEPVPGAAAGGYRDAPPTERVARVVDIVDPAAGWWARITPQDLFGLAARLAAALCIAAAIVG